MANDQMTAQMSKKGGFIAALDQSGGSSPGALRLYGIPDSAYSGEAEMFRLIHQMRVRIMTAPAFTGDKVIGTILFEGTMDGEVRGKPTASYLWEERHVVPFVKVDRGLEPEKDGVQLMRPMPQLDQLCDRAVKAGVYGTKMRSVINLANEAGIAEVVGQQFEVAAHVLRHGLVPIIEPEVNIKSAERDACDRLLRDEILRHLDRLAEGTQVMLKLSIPAEAGLFQEAVGSLAGTLLEAGLQGPDFLDVPGDAAGNGKFFGLAVQHRVHGDEEGRMGGFARLASGRPTRQHLVPQQGGEEETGGDGLALAHPLIGVLEGQPHEALAQGLLQDHVQER